MINLRGIQNAYVQQKGAYNNLHTFNLEKARGEINDTMRCNFAMLTFH
jgi:hypothetical protein